MEKFTKDDLILIASALRDYADSCEERAQMWSGHADPYGDAALWRQDRDNCLRLWTIINNANSASAVGDVIVELAATSADGGQQMSAGGAWITEPL